MVFTEKVVLLRIPCASSGRHMRTLRTHFVHVFTTRRTKKWAVPSFLLFIACVIFVHRSAHRRLGSLLSIQDGGDTYDVSTPLPVHSPYPEWTVGTAIHGDELINVDSNRNLVTFYSMYNLAKHFGPAQVVVLVDRREICDRFPPALNGVRCVGIEHCTNPEYAAPTMDCIFQSLLVETRTELVGFINGDILTFESLAESLTVSALNIEEFFMVGRRYTSTSTPPVLVDLDDLDNLEILARSLNPDSGYAIDYFFTRKSLALRITLRFPAFVVGTFRWDNVLLSMCYKLNDCVVIDATRAAPVLHVASKHVERHVDRPAAAYNQAVAMFCCGDDYIAGSIDYADFILQRRSQGDYFLSTQALHLKVLRCSLRNGILASPDHLPGPVKGWLKKLKSGVPRGTGVEALVNENIRCFLQTKPRFRFLMHETEPLFVYYEPTLMNFIFSLGQPAGSACLERISPESEGSSSEMTTR